MWVNGDDDGDDGDDDDDDDDDDVDDVDDDADDDVDDDDVGGQMGRETQGGRKETDDTHMSLRNMFPLQL